MSPPLRRTLHVAREVGEVVVYDILFYGRLQLRHGS